jgi:uncharacterized membrane protein
MKNVKEIKTISIGAFIYVCASIALGYFLKDGLIIFLGWNMTLSFFAYGLSVSYSYTIEKNKLFLATITGLLWILFFPNTLYMLTDFIHFQNVSFFETYMSVYDFNIPSWLIFTHILIGALFSAFIGIKSVDLVLKIVVDKYRVNQILSLLILFSTSSFAIYIGRFLRLNSWDILKPFSLLVTVISSIDLFTVVFVLLFTGIHFFTYYMFHQFKNE